MTKDEKVGWHNHFKEHILEQTLGENEGEGGLSCRSPCSHKRVGCNCLNIKNQVSGVTS